MSSVRKIRALKLKEIKLRNKIKVLINQREKYERELRQVLSEIASINEELS